MITLTNEHKYTNPDWNLLPQGTLIQIIGGRTESQIEDKVENDLIGHVLFKMTHAWDKEKDSFDKGEHFTSEGEECIIDAIDLTNNNGMMSYWNSPFDFTDGTLQWVVIPNGTSLTITQPVRK